MSISDEIDPLTTEFSGVVSVSRRTAVEFECAYGLAERAHGIAAATDTCFGIASGAKGLTATLVMSLVADGVLSLDTTARSILGPALPLIASDVTVEHLLAHRSGIGDYCDEDVETPLKVPVQELDATTDYLPALDGFPSKFAAGSRFGYCNSGFVVLALIAERVVGRSFHDLVAERVLVPAGMTETWFPRSDELPGRAAVGYLEDGRTNVFSLPVRGSGDGGAYSSVTDIRKFWLALFAGRIVGRQWVDQLVRAHSDVPHLRARYGLGLWLDETGQTVLLEGCDDGVSFRSAHDPESGLTWTVVANTTDGAFPVARRIRELVADRQGGTRQP